MKVRQFASIFTLALLFTVQTVFAQSEESILGVWYNTEKTAKVQITQNGKEFMGKIIWLLEPERNGVPAMDDQNDDEKLRKRPLMGLTILEGLQYKNGAWKGGKIYDPKSGNTYSCEIKLLNSDVLEVTGYMGFSWIGRTVEWTKAED
ncbi:DUF2147 domain-containing protein [Algoriphagus kandeliae]|uniref:DUF2147 domain-containing protein n=1 Tax=Algoriphagus kandeliae TaxID=2562278 RepID=A0A4Y9R269_9BACT|nr:DUF2147 domain-containing protein [Algoriphagus kandeliae]TFV97723.1 DUF2147 domain-containing protein [Algoriphagus kandeliae]